jgi:hypothetical protein
VSETAGAVSLGKTAAGSVAVKAGAVVPPGVAISVRVAAAVVATVCSVGSFVMVGLTVDEFAAAVSVDTSLRLASVAVAGFGVRVPGANSGASVDGEIALRRLPQAPNTTQPASRIPDAMMRCLAVLVDFG